MAAASGVLQRSAAASMLQRSARPTPAEVAAVVRALAALHGKPNRLNHAAGLQPGCELREPHTVLDSLVRTILSQNTTDVTSARAYTSLKEGFPSWQDVLAAPPGAVAASIRVGGLADIKTARIQVGTWRNKEPHREAILASLLEERGELSLEHLRQLPCDDVKAALSRYKGVGPKSIACVMLFCLGRAECPVDTHVHHIAQLLGWVPGSATREATYDHLNAVVPDEHKYELHVLLVEHGKVCPACAKRAGVSSSKGKNKGKSGAAAGAASAVVCPLAPFKRGAAAAAAAAAEAEAAKVNAAAAIAAAGGKAAVKAEPAAQPALTAGAAAEGAGGAATVKQEHDDGAAAAAAAASPSNAADAAAPTTAAIKREQGGVFVKQERQDGQVEAAAAAPPPPSSPHQRKRSRR